MWRSPAKRLKNLPFNSSAPNNVGSGTTSTEDPSHSLDAPPQDDIPASIKSTVCTCGLGADHNRECIMCGRYVSNQLELQLVRNVISKDGEPRSTAHEPTCDVSVCPLDLPATTVKLDPINETPRET
jgi:hypothetical protein